MSNLNVNNIDVQRIINVLNELNRKMKMCSFLTYKTMENIENNWELLKEKIRNQEFFEDLEKHFALMKEFRVTHIEIKEEEEEKEGEKNSDSKEDENNDELEDGEMIPKEKEIKERKDLIGIDEKTSTVTEKLAKSTRNFCRKYHKEIMILKELKMYRMDSEINKFCKNFSFLLKNYIKKTKMTLEEEQSEKSINFQLIAKISDLESQIKFKTIKYDALKKERHNFKTNCNNQLNDIENEIKALRDNTKNHLTKLENDINNELNDDNEKNQKRLAELSEKLNIANAEYEEKKKKDEEDERILREQYNAQENALRNFIHDEYDLPMAENRGNMKISLENHQMVKLKKKEAEIERNIAKEKYENQLESFKRHEERLRKLKYEHDMKIMASEYISGQVKGFFARKANKKKFGKILGPLKKPVLEPVDTVKPKGKNK